jgi:hypothetical protein
MASDGLSCLEQSSLTAWFDPADLVEELHRALVLAGEQSWCSAWPSPR